ncbi:hypothetical protein ANPL_01795 [Anaplasma platys]|uniref:3-hydroxyacyl-CoA dehydrogenase C-terminal domain-containing protein n=1 Tax=Anaplasma platys TaxID=949 RepID=A0A858PY16_9RICK|nr:hypothetical protein [Anaplasma platys]QJC27462.1 hypothetical protein ANPL_01795 [Anaplasma platys]
MLNKILAVVDPTLSHKSLIQRCVDVGIDVLVYCEEGRAMPPGAQVEIRSFNGGFCDIGDACCVLELIPEGASKAAFYNSPAVKNGKMLLLSYGMTSAQYGEIHEGMSGSLASRVAGVSFPSFYQHRPTFECILYAESVEPCFRLVQKNFSCLISMLRTSIGSNLFDRFGYFWAGTCAISALRTGMMVEVADRLVSNEDTGVCLGAFKVLDALGLDKFIAGLEALVGVLGKDDLLHQVRCNLPGIVQGMISDGLYGAGGRGGFYRIYDMRYGSVEQVIDLQSGLYRSLKKDESLQDSLLDTRKNSMFSDELWKQVFTYVEHIVKERGTDVIKELDEVLRVGYNWQFCVKELASRVGIRSFF